MGGIQKAWVHGIAIFVFAALFSTGGVVPASAERRSLAGAVSSTFRIRAETPHGISTTIGHGTAFAIDLSEFGGSHSRHILTACHVIRNSRGAVCPVLKVEIKNGGTVRWARCRVLASDPKLDVALLECETELPVSASFAARDAAIGTHLVMIGSPAGVPLRVITGSVTENNRLERSVAYVTFIREGCSGGPIFDANTHQVVGLVVAGIGKNAGSSMDPHTCLYVSLSQLQRYIRGALRTKGGGAKYKSAPKPSPRYCEPCTPIYREPLPRNYYRTAGRKVDYSGMWLP